MPRHERPLLSEDTPVLKFAGDLRRLRQRAGLPPYRELGRLANYSAAALSEAVAGRRLPSLAVTRAFVRACGGDVEEWTARWRSLVAAPEQRPEDCPYVGLAAYRVEDADRFFGREALVDSLLALVDERCFVGVFGPSGSGKSSLLRAGLVARSGRTGLVVTPGADPLTAIAAAIAGPVGRSAVEVRAELAADPGHLRVLLRQVADDPLVVVDQFEEAFTLCGEADRAWLVRALTGAASGATRVVLGVRADFYGHCGRHPELVAALHRAQLLVGPMSVDELRRAATEPAARRGVSLETSLLTRLLADVAGRPGALPLVSHVLVETWRRRRGTVLSLAAYEDAGGVGHALARTAEEVYGALTEEDRHAVRRVLLRLTAPGDGTEDTKRRAHRHELDVGDELLGRLSAARLIALDRDAVELAHEALLRAWPRLAAWLDEDRDALRAHRRLTEAAAAWRAHHRDPDALYRGAHLEQADRLRDRLNPGEREFLDASLASQRELLADRRRGVRRLRRLVAGLVVLAVLLAGTAVYAGSAQRTAARERNEALSLRAADAAVALAHSRPGHAVALARAAYLVAPTTEARDALLLAAAAGGAETLGGGFAFPPDRIALTLDRQGDRLWARDGDRWRRAAALPPESFPYLVSADQRTLLTRATTGDSFRLWDVGDPDSPREVATVSGWPLFHGMDAAGALLTAVEDEAAVTWRPGDAHRTRLPATAVEHAVPLPDGTGVVLSRREGGSHHVELWSANGTPHRVATLLSRTNRLYPHPGPRGLVAVVDLDTSDLTVLDAADPGSPRTLLEADGVPERPEVGFSPDGRALAAVHRGAVALWDLASGRSLLSLRTPGLEFSGPRYDPESRRLRLVEVRSGELWQFDTDFERVLRETCAEPAGADWETYFPGVPHRSVCP
ncbi:XRE family transcriptional regulator [Saccharothrix xinjiangensis]|uniref:XRE family transcriptional regulator n=1 Tax=Saccharothrix xinjiangensis TaxID=204798 RepID=A0ABV9Y3J5_9PSEU